MSSKQYTRQGIADHVEANAGVYNSFELAVLRDFVAHLPAEESSPPAPVDRAPEAASAAVLERIDRIERSLEMLLTVSGRPSLVLESVLDGVRAAPGKERMPSPDANPHAPPLRPPQEPPRLSHSDRSPLKYGPPGSAAGVGVQTPAGDPPLAPQPLQGPLPPSGARGVYDVRQI